MSTLDLFLVSPYESVDAEMSVIGDVGSDHLLILLQLGAECLATHTELPRERYRFGDVEWELYSSCLERNLRVAGGLFDEIRSSEDLDRAAEAVEVSIIDAANQHIPKRSSNGPMMKQVLPLHVVQLIERRNRIMRRITRGEVHLKPERNRLRRLIESEIYMYRCRTWQKVCDSIDDRNPHKTYSMIQHGMLGRRVGSNALKYHGQTLRTPQEKSCAFAETLRHAYRPQNAPHFSAMFQQQIETIVSDNPHIFQHLREDDATDDGHILSRPVGVEEVASLLANVKNRSPGPDGIYNIMLYRGPDLLQTVLAKVYSKCLSIGYMPMRWKQAETVMIPKPEKDRSAPGNYRPISLLSVLAKLLEGIIARRLNRHLETRGVLNRYQSGFREGRSTNDHLLRLTQSVSEAFNQKLSVYAVFLDVAKAFDTVWHDGLRAKLCSRRFGLPRKMIRFLSDYLKNRQFRVRCGNSVSEWNSIEAGVPQGGSLSPLLFLLYVNDIPFEEDRHCAMSQFADDLALWSTSANASSACQRLQRKLDSVIAWCDLWRVSLNSAKSQAMLFKKGACRTQRQPALLNIRGQPITLTERVRFLGVIFDPRLTFTPHVQRLTKSSKARLSVLASVCGFAYGPPCSTALRLYMSYVRPVLEYGAPSWSQVICQSNRDILERLQNQGCRMALRLPFWTPRTQLRRLSRLQPINDRLRALSVSYLRKARMTNTVISEMATRVDGFMPNEFWNPTPVERLRPNHQEA